MPNLFLRTTKFHTVYSLSVTLMQVHMRINKHTTISKALFLSIQFQRPKGFHYKPHLPSYFHLTIATNQINKRERERSATVSYFTNRPSYGLLKQFIVLNNQGIRREIIWLERRLSQ